MDSMHVLCGTGDDIQLLRRVATTQRPTAWIMPKNARRGDEVAVFVRGQGFLATGTVRMAPRIVTTGFWAGKYRGSIDQVCMLPAPVSEAAALKALRAWKWLTYPRSYTTVTGQTADGLQTLLASEPPEALPDVDMVEVVEGRRRLHQHLAIERNQAIVTRLKRSVMGRTGKLACQVCAFDFAATYGDVGLGFCEAHHLRPIGQRKRAGTTKLGDLAVVCSNCHRMLHRGVTSTLARLKSIIAAQKRHLSP